MTRFRDLVPHPVLAASLGLALVVVVRLLLPGRRWVVVWTRVVAGLGLLLYLVRIGRMIIEPGESGWDLEIFYRAGREAAAGLDPYVHPGRDVFLNPPPALGLLRPLSALPLGMVRAGWEAVSAGLALGLISQANRILRRGHEADRTSPPPLPADLAALLTVALVHSTGATLGLLAGQFSTLTAIALLFALSARQAGQSARAGVWLALAAFKPATAIPFLVLFLRSKDRATWAVMAAVSLALALTAVPTAQLKTRVVTNLRQIERSGAPGGANDYDPATESSADMIAVNHALIRLGFRDRPVVSALQTLAGALLLALAVVVSLRRPFAVASAVIACVSMLFLYHRLYDTVILALPLALAASVARGTRGTRRVLATFCVALLLAAANLPRERMIELTRRSLGVDPWARFLSAVVLPCATWAIVLAIPCLLLCTRPAPARASLPEGTALPPTAQ